MAREKLMYPPRVMSFNDPAFPDGKMVDYDIYHDAIKNRKIGDRITSWAGAPGTGFIEYIITRMDHTGVYGIIARNTIRELSPEEVV